MTQVHDDSLQRRQSRDPGHSCIVQAPAGSGKTELLTQRMLGLLSRVENPEEVVAITFTRKAAAEMNHRLVTRLRAATTESEKELEPHEQVSRELALAALQNDEARGWNLLEQPSRLRIRTIDSLCSELARQLPILSGLGGGQQIAEDAEPLYRLAAARTMAAIEDKQDELQADIIRVLGRYDNQYDRLVDLLTSMLSHREQWIGHLLAIRTGDSFDRKALEDALTLLVEAELQSLLELVRCEDLLTGIVPYVAYAAGNLPDESALPLKSLLAACGVPESGPVTLAATADTLQHWVALARFLLTQGGTFRSHSHVEAQTENLTAQGGDLARHAIQSRLVIAGSDHKIGAARGHRQGDRPADTARRAGHGHVHTIQAKSVGFKRCRGRRWL